MRHTPISSNIIQDYLDHLAKKTHTYSHPTVPSVHCRYTKTQPGCEDENFPPEAGRLISAMMLVSR